MNETIPASPPAVWWSPSLAARSGHAAAILYRDVHGLHDSDGVPVEGNLPADAVRLVPLVILPENFLTEHDADRFAAKMADIAGAVPDTGQAREIHNLLGQLADRSTSPDVLDSATEHVVRTNVRNGRPTSARFVGHVLAELDQARATQSSGETVQAPPAEIAGWDGPA